MLCPLCKIPTMPKDESGLMETSCPQCHGIWVTRLALRGIMAHELSNSLYADESVADLTVAVAQSDTTKTLYCPDCHVALVKDRIHPLIPVQVDACPKCDYVWFDPSEQMLFLRHYRELMKTDDPQLADQRDKLEHLESMYHQPMSDARQFDKEIAEIAVVIGVATNIISGVASPAQLASRIAVQGVIGLLIWLYVHHKAQPPKSPSTE